MKKFTVLSILFLTLVQAYSSVALTDSSFLPAEQAFKFTHLKNDRDLLLQWQIADGYYLYQERLSITANGKPVTLPQLPEAKPKDDAYFGETMVYYQFLDLNIPINDNISTVTVNYQGCAEAGLCYPPQTVTLNWPSTDTPAPTEQAAFLERLNHGNIIITLLGFFLFGVIAAFSGCTYPMFPILSKIIIGEGEKITKARGLSLSLAYVLPIAAVYALVGVLAGFLGNNVLHWMRTPVALIAIAAVLVAMSLSLFGLYEIQMPQWLRNKSTQSHIQPRNGRLLSAALMGLISAFIVSACVVPPFVAAMTFITQTGHMWLGAGVMFCFGLGLGAPLILLGVSAGWLLPKAGKWMLILQRLMGIFLLSAAVFVVNALIPDGLAYILWALLASAAGLYLLRSINHRIIRLIIIISTVLISGILAGYATQWYLNKDQKLAFTYIANLSELEHALAANDNRPIFLDYYADWCSSCRYLENQVFTEPRVAATLATFHRIKIDLTELTQEKQALMDQHGVIGPPALLIFDRAGNEIHDLRIVGEINASDLLNTLEQVH